MNFTAFIFSFKNFLDEQKLSLNPTTLTPPSLPKVFISIRRDVFRSQWSLRHGSLMLVKRNKVFTILTKSSIQYVWLSSEYGYSIYSKTDFKGMKPHDHLKVYKFCWIVFRFLVNSFLFLSSLWPKVFSSLYTFMMDFLFEI